MPYCPTCSNPTQSTWRNCAVCGSVLHEVLDTEQLKTHKPGMSTTAKVAIAATSVIVVAAVSVGAILLLNRPSQANPKPVETSQNVDESEEPEQKSAAQAIVDRLLAENICTSSWSAEDYAQAPSLNIGTEYWESGDVRVCQVDRTSNSTTRWVTVITGQNLLQTYGAGWAVEPMSIAIHSNDWTIVTSTILKGDPVRDDPVVQSILVKLGGNYSLPSK